MFSQSEIRLSSCDSVSTNESAEEKLLIGLITFIGFWYRILGIRRSPTRLDKLEPSFWQFSTTSTPATLCRERLLHSMQRFLSSWVEKNSIKSLIWNLNSYQSCRTLISFVWSFILPDQFRVFSNILSVSLLRQPDLSQFCLLWPTQRKVSWENYFPIDWELLYLCRNKSGLYCCSCNSIESGGIYYFHIFSFRTKLCISRRNKTTGITTPHNQQVGNHAGKTKFVKICKTISEFSINSDHKL